MIQEALLAFIVAALLGVFGFYEGNKHGTDAQKVADQSAFDKVNAERSKQKSDAAAILNKIEAGIIAQQADDAKLRKTIDEQAALLDRANTDMHALFATRKLQFVAPARKGGTNRSCGAGAPSPTPSSPIARPPTIVQLPVPIADGLRQLVLDADNLRVEYGKCYEWVQGVNHAP